MISRLLLAALVVILAHSSATAFAQSFNLTLLHTNDTHGHLLPFSYPETFDQNAAIAKLASRSNIGGAARRATLVKRIRAEKDRHVLLTDSGDICDGTPFSTEYHGDADIAAMNAIGYDLACPGNHEYNNTLAQVQKMAADAKFPLISANSKVKTTGELVYKPYIIREVGGAKIAFLGLLTYDAQRYPAAKTDIVMERPIEVAKRLVPELRKQADLVIAVTHIGLSEDKQLAQQVPGIDIILGGHSHTHLPQPMLVPASTGTSTQSVNGTVIVQDHQWGGTLGRLDLTITKGESGTWAVSKYAGKLITITHDIPEDPAVAAVVAKFWDPIKAKYGEVIGQAAGDFAKRGFDYAEYHLVADAIRSELGVEFDLENPGGVRAPLVKGPITYADLATLDPFTNTIVKLTVTGKQLKQILLKASPAVSGIRYKVDGGVLVESSINGKPIDDNSTYSGTTNSYMAGLPALKEVVSQEDTGKKRLETIITYIRKQKTVSPSYDGRRVIVGESD